VSQSIAENNPHGINNGQYEDQNGDMVYQRGDESNGDDEEPFLVDCYDININGGKFKILTFFRLCQLH
jgi:hypothetical protein